MKKILIVIACALSLSACSTTEQGAGIGAVAGGVLGAAATGTVAGAAIGAGVGAVAGAVVGEVSGRPGYCYYYDRHHNRYASACPRGYHGGGY